LALDDGLAVTSPCKGKQHNGYRAHRTTLGDGLSRYPRSSREVSKSLTRLTNHQRWFVTCRCDPAIVGHGADWGEACSGPEALTKARGLQRKSQNEGTQ